MSDTGEHKFGGGGAIFGTTKKTSEAGTNTRRNTSFSGATWHKNANAVDAGKHDRKAVVLLYSFVVFDSNMATTPLV